MLYADVLTGYLICGTSSLVAAALLFVVETSEERTRDALRGCAWSFVVLGLSLLPAGLGPAVVHPAAQLTMTFGSQSGLVLLARGLGQLQGRILSLTSVGALIAVLALLNGFSYHTDPIVFGAAFAAQLAALCSLILWMVRGLVFSPRGWVERTLGLAIAALTLSAWLRLAFTLAYEGSPQPHIMYAPPVWLSILAVLYGMLPMIIATLLMNLVNMRLNQQLDARASTDDLTGALTRRALRETAPLLLAREHERQRDVAVLMIDLDRFKEINDTYGHQKGDAVLQAVARRLLARLRPGALLARYGGEEFVALIPVDDLAAARRVAERLRLAVSDADWSAKLQLSRRVTISLGLTIIGPGDSLEQALSRADEALYRAKRDGRNQCQVSLAAA